MSLLARIGRAVAWLTAILVVAGVTWAVGVDVTSVDTDLAAEQDIDVGDQIWITQPGYPTDLGHVVADVRPGRALVMALSTPDQRFAPEDAPWTWTFVVEPQDDGTTRLVSRQRNATIGTAGDAMWDRVVGPISFAMARWRSAAAPR